MEREFTSTSTNKKEEKELPEDENLKGVFFRCSFCPCVFLTEADLQKHYACMGSKSEEHLDYYRRTHARIEHGSYTTE
jgi:hypothetical protein